MDRSIDKNTRVIDLGPRVIEGSRPLATIEILESPHLENDAGAVVWDACLVLVHYLAHRGLISPSDRVIDVGTGPGAAGIAAAALGASPVVLTDLPHLRPLAEANITLNGLTDVASFADLRWGDPVDALNPPFDVVLASDVVYQREWLEPLATTLASLAAPHTRVFIANEHRPGLPFPTDCFTTAGFEVTEVPFDELHPEWRSEDIQIYSLKKLER